MKCYVHFGVQTRTVILFVFVFFLALYDSSYHDIKRQTLSPYKAEPDCFLCFFGCGYHSQSTPLPRHDFRTSSLKLARLGGKSFGNNEPLFLSLQELPQEENHCFNKNRCSATSFQSLLTGCQSGDTKKKNTRTNHLQPCLSCTMTHIKSKLMLETWLVSIIVH